MRRVAFFLIYLIYCSVSTFGQLKKVNVQPAYVAAKLMDIVVAESYPQVVTYYGYQRDSTAAPGTNTYTYSDGSTVTWLDSLTQEQDTIHEMTFRTPQSISSIDKALTSVGYTKTTRPKVDKPKISGVRYEKRNKYSNRSKVIIVQPGAQTTLYLIHKR